MLNGRIININSTKYVIETDNGIFNTTLRGIFRKDKITPVVGDNIIYNEEKNIIENILPRNNLLTRPNIANIDYAIIVISVKKPDLDLNLLDKLLVFIINSNINPLICFTKIDLLNKEELKEFNEIKKYYDSIGINTYLNTEIDKLKKKLSKKITTLCGQTGAGKSTFLNKIDNTLKLETNEISESLGRGKHTTRYVSLYKIEDFYIADTPGFSSLDINLLNEEDIRNGFIEFNNYQCKYNDCNHINTEGCSVFNEVGKNIRKSRYENYQKFIEERNKKWK